MSSPVQAAITAQASTLGTAGGKLVLCNKPKANIYLFFTVPAAQNGGIEVQKYTTRYGVTFEKHIAQNGVVTWWRLLKL